MRNMDGNPIGGNYALAGPVQCELSELISGMANSMLGTRLNEIRQIEIHPEFAYGIFSSFGEGKAVSITIELAGCEVTAEKFSPCWIPVDIAKRVKNDSTPIDFPSLQRAYMFSCGQRVWSFYKKKLQNIALADVVKILLAEDFATLTDEDREVLHKLQWLIWNST
jgi:FKBP-type peptidyl-prolyl cis-trans isomerase